MPLNNLHQQEKWGIFGGTFDPIHVGHINVVREVCSVHALQRVHFVPTFIPPHRAQPEVSAAHRMAMVKLAVAGDHRFIADDREFRRAGTSFMFDTVTSLKAEFPVICFHLILGWTRS